MYVTVPENYQTDRTLTFTFFIHLYFLVNDWVLEYNTAICTLSESGHSIIWKVIWPAITDNQILRTFQWVEAGGCGRTSVDMSACRHASTRDC